VHVVSYLIFLFVNLFLSFEFINIWLISIIVDDFYNYDYGIAENYKRYKQKTPPSYDLKKITAPIILFYAANDWIVTEEVINKFSF